MSDTEITFTDEEFFEISSYLRDKHAIFSKFWEIGKPVFTRDIMTAAVSAQKSDEGTGNITFIFNPDFWKQCDDYTKRFVICHEMLHLILNHIVRIKDANKENTKEVNVCADLVVNHLLVRRFGFNRNKIKGFTKEFLEEVEKSGRKIDRNLIFGDYRDFCWVDGVFDPKLHPERTANTNGKIPADNMSFEAYYNLLPKPQEQPDKPQDQDGQQGGPQSGKGEESQSKGIPDPSGQPPDKTDDFPSTIDDHSGLKEIEIEKIEEVMENLNKELTDAEKEDVEDMVSKHFQNNINKDISPKNKMAGTSGGGFFTFSKIDPRKVKKNKKWESVIKKWAFKHMTHATKEKEQWARTNRRMTMLPKDFFIPSEYEEENMFWEEDKIEVFFICDLSGSCLHLVNRFFKATMSLPTNRFKIRLFTFDTKCVETSMEEVASASAGVGKIYGGGGTSFSCIERKIQEIIKRERIDHPKAVFVLTDCYGDKVSPQHPERWHIFMTEGHANPHSYFPFECSFYDLSEYE